MKTIPSPQIDKYGCFVPRPESARKFVECAFGVLQSRFNIVRRPTCMWKRQDVVNIITSCIILHNMIIEDEKEQAMIHIDLNMNPGASIALPPKVSTQVNPCFEDVLQRNSEIQDKAKHIALKKDLVEHIWEQYGKK
jgi:hypothetical protein